MAEDAIGAAAEAVAVARLAARPLGPLAGLVTVEDGYRAQAIANARLEVALGARVGHKIGGTTADMRAYLNLEEPVAGEVFASGLHPPGGSVERGRYRRLGIETEIAVRLGSDLRRPCGREEAAAAVAEMMASIELVDDRYLDFKTIGAPMLIADNAFDAGLVLGAPAPGWRALALDQLAARTLLDGKLVSTGRSDALLGHPLDALAWLATRRAPLGLGLAAGTVVSLGSITPVHWVTAPGRFRIEVEGLGAVELAVT